MKYRIIGSNKQTSAKVTMEVEAESKAAAERKALNAGLSVTRVEDITDGDTRQAIVHGGSMRSNSSNRFIKLILFAAIVGAAYFFLWPKLRGMIGK